MDTEKTQCMDAEKTVVYGSRENLSVRKPRKLRPIAHTRHNQTANLLNAIGFLGYAY